MESPFVIEVFDKTFHREGWIGDPLAVSATPRHNAIGTCTFSVASDHRRLPALAASGARCRIKYLDQHLLSGRVSLLGGKGPGLSGEVELTVEDDFRLLYSVLGWPVPTASLTGQTVAYDTRTGPAESVAKAFVQANAINRLGLPVTNATDLGRGANVTVSLRMRPLADRLLPVIEPAGIGLTVRQEGAGLVVDAYEPVDYPRLLSEESGTVSDWKWSSAAPMATRVVAGLQGEATARTFYALTDPARETEWGDKIEVFRDARDIEDDPSLANSRMQESLDEGAPTSGLSLTLSETRAFSYDPTGTTGVRVGDRVRIAVGPDVIVQDLLREVTLTYTTEEGLSVTPVVGQRTDDPDRALARTVAALARGFRNLTAGR